MPRIRTLKPDHRLHRKVGPLDDTTYRLWVGMILEADDDGRLVADTHQLKALVFGLRPQTTKARIDLCLQDLAALKLIHIYSVDNTRYVWFPSWKDHQRINRPTPSRLPACPEELERMVQQTPTDSVRTHGGLTEDSLGKGSGREGKGKEVEGKGAPPEDFSLALEKLRTKLGPTQR